MIRGLKEFINRQFSTEQYEVLREFTVYHPGWEMDEVAAVVQVNGKTVVVGTNHGSPCLMSKNELYNKLNEYGKVMGDTRLAINEMD